MAGYDDPNYSLVNRISGGLARLFGPRDNSAAMKYMLGASQVAENKANIGKLDSETANNTQVHGFRGTASQSAPGALDVDPASPMGQLFGAIFGMTKDASDGATALGNVRGQQMLANPDVNEGNARRAMGIMGKTVNVNDAVTQDGLGQHRAQETALNNADNSTLRQNAQTSAAASRYGHDRDYDAALYKVDHGVYNAGEGDILFRDGQPVAYGQPKAPGKGGAGGAGGEITPTEAKALQVEILNSLPEGVELDPRQMTEAVRIASAITRQTGDAGDAIARVRQMVSIDGDGVAQFSPVLFRNDTNLPPIGAQRTPASGAAALFAPPPAPVQQAQGLPQAAMSALKEGEVTTFRNGQSWTLQNGQPVQVK
jgi:hypothetical protein